MVAAILRRTAYAANLNLVGREVVPFQAAAVVARGQREAVPPHAQRYGQALGDAPLVLEIDAIDRLVRYQIPEGQKVVKNGGGHTQQKASVIIELIACRPALETRRSAGERELAVEAVDILKMIEMLAADFTTEADTVRRLLPRSVEIGR